MTDALNWLSVYLIAGMAHYLLMLRAAFILDGYHGKVMQMGMTRVPLRLFLGVIVSWPVAAYRAMRKRRGVRRLLVAEPIVFVVAGVGLMLLG